MIQAEIIADSINGFGNRLTTFILTFPRIILAEFNTHRMLSKNSASSRAIPFAKMLNMVKENPFMPLKWMREHSGMQGTEYFTDPNEIHINEMNWIAARDYAVASAEHLHNLGITKQLCNRILEPFMYHKVIVTGSEWENFFALRAHEAAEIHIQKLAYEMMEAYNNSIPKKIVNGGWHIPYGDKIDSQKCYDIIEKENISFLGDLPDFEKSEGYTEMKIKIATARCARVSYTVVGEEDKPDNYENDIKLHDRLAKMGHFSPFEHCGRAMNNWEYNSGMTLEDDVPDKLQGWSGNFRGFIQYRKTLDNENRNDSRVIKKNETKK